MGTGIANAYSAQLGQSTPTTQATAMLSGQRAKRVWGGVRKRKRKTAAAAPRRRKTAKRAKRGGKFVKGSVAARRHMAKLRRMRKRR